MKELFNLLPKTKDKNLVLLDTCSFIHIFSKQRFKDLENLCSSKKVALTSFNIEELLFVLQRNLQHHVKDSIRRFLKNRTNLFVKDIPVHPGNIDSEKIFISKVDNELIKHIHDPSDAVLIAAAIQSKSTVLTKDKYHLFTSNLINYLKNKNVKVLKEIHDIL